MAHPLSSKSERHEKVDKRKTIRSLDEFTEQTKELSNAIWTLGESLGRQPSDLEIKKRLEQWYRDSSPPMREKIILIEHLLMWSNWREYAPILFKALEAETASRDHPS